VNWYLPVAMVPAVAILSTILETCFGLALLVGWQTRKAALGSSVLLTLFAVAMFSGNPKSPFDYSVFTAAFGALALATRPRTRLSGHLAFDRNVRSPMFFCLVGGICG